MSSISSQTNIQVNAILSKFTTFRLGGPCEGLVQCSKSEELFTAVHYFHQQNKKFILIGGGSNIVVADEGLDYFVIRFFSDTPQIVQDGTDLIVCASTSLDALALYAAEHGLDGINYCSGIPGTVGGAIAGNAGAFGKQIGDVLDSAELISFTGSKKEVKQDYFHFGYRHSILKDTKEIVVSVRLSLVSDQKKDLIKKRNEILHLRKSKHPDLLKDFCAGSFFRNIEPTSKAGKRQAAGWFLEQAGIKGFTCGGAFIYDKHANIIIHNGKAKSSDVMKLSEKMQVAVKEKFDLDLVREVQFFY